MKQSKSSLIIFVKNPILGKVKTRLAASLGDEKALKVYQQLLNITEKATKNVNCEKHLFYSDKIEQNDFWDKHIYTKHVQQQGELGERMKNAFKELFSGGNEKVLIIGSDCPEITSNTINKAFRLLEKKDVVIGPARDGGYYLLGMKESHPFIFDNKQWSTNTVLNDTIKNLVQKDLSYKLLPMLSDIDTINDLHLLNGITRK